MTISEKTQIIIVYSYDADDQRLIGSFEYRWDIGTGLPNQSTNITPPKLVSGKVPVFNIEIEKWILVEDNRDKTVYSTTTQAESKIDYIGAIKDGFTELKPSSIFDTWTGTEWFDARTDEEKEAHRLSAYAPLSRRQFKLALLNHDLLLTVESSINAIEDPRLKMRIKIEYEESQTFLRTNTSVIYMLPLLKLTDQQVDEMWLEAMTL